VPRTKQPATMPDAANERASRDEYVQ